MNVITNRIAFRQYDASRCNWKTCKQKVRIFICTDFCPILWPVGIKYIVADDCIITWWRQKKDNGSWSLFTIVFTWIKIFLWALLDWNLYISCLFTHKFQHGELWNEYFQKFFGSQIIGIPKKKIGTNFGWSKTDAI